MSIAHISRVYPAKSQWITEDDVLTTKQKDTLLETAVERIGKLETALRMVLENQGGHQHWDSFGTAGANCPICQQQQEAATQAWEVLRGKPQAPLTPTGESLRTILEWYEQIPNDELPPDHVKKAFRQINDVMGVPEK